MNPALTYLWFTLLKRRVFQICRSLRRPGTFIGFCAVLFLAGMAFRFRHEPFYSELIRRESLIGCALLMLCGSLFKGFLQRGLSFELADVDFLFTGAFTQHQIVFYRLLPQYLFAVVQGFFFFAIFKAHLAHPILVTICFILFQIACFHIAIASAIFGGTLVEALHRRICWMLLAVYFLITITYLRTAWEIRIIPSFITSLPSQILFYPAISLADSGSSPSLRQWLSGFANTNSIAAQQLWHSSLWFAAFAVGALSSLWLLMKLKADIFETSLTVTTRVAERRQRIRRGQSIIELNENEFQSLSLPASPWLRGMGAIVWKNFVVALRSRRELALALAFTIIFTLFIVGLRVAMRRIMSEGGIIATRDLADFDMGLASFMGFLGFLLQRALPFDFRRDGQHLLGFRTLPISSFQLVAAEIAVPIVLCLAFQALGVLALSCIAGFQWPMLLCLALAYPAIALALNGVWNLHYLLSATKRAAGRAQSSSAIGVLMIVALSFFIFYPAGWTAVTIGNHLKSDQFFALAAVAAIAVQYAVDFLLVIILAKLFERFEVSRDAQ